MTPKSREASREAFEGWAEDWFGDWSMTPNHVACAVREAWQSAEAFGRSQALEEAAQACGAIVIKHYLPKDYEQNLLGGGAEECETAIRALKERG